MVLFADPGRKLLVDILSLRRRGFPGRPIECLSMLSAELATLHRPEQAQRTLPNTLSEFPIYSARREIGEAKVTCMLNGSEAREVVELC